MNRKTRLTEPRRGTYDPEPLATDQVSLPPELASLVERLARNAHELWAAERIRTGWTYGPRRDDAARTTPWLVPFDQLPDDEQTIDSVMATQTVKAILALGYRIERRE